MLEEYMTGFRERNPQLRVFSAHLHMDEATPQWKHGYLLNRRWQRKDFKAAAATIQSGINGYARRKINFRL